MQVSADMRGIESYVAGVRGMVEAMETPGVQGDFINHVMNVTKKKFRLDTIMAHEAGLESIKHVFEWGDSEGNPSSIPLFKLTKGEMGRTKTLSYTFLPSTKRVPLPSASYGIPADVMDKIKPQIFPMKAYVMETQTRVDIRPKRAKMILIPTRQSSKGFVMRPSSQVNPGGPQATGGFANWWNAWFDGNADVIAKGESVKTEEFLKKTGQRIVRWAAGTTRGGVAVGGQFAKQKVMDFGYIDGNAARWKGDVEKRLKRFYADREDEGDDE